MSERSEKTKQAIRLAYLGLLKDQPVGRITVKQVSEVAEINRNTFYTYFESVYDLNDEIFNTISHDLSLRQVGSQDDFNECVEKSLSYVICYLDEHHELLHLAFNTKQGRDVESNLTLEAISFLRIASHTSFGDQIAVAQLTFMVYAVVGVLSQWLDGRLRLSRDELMLFTYNSIKLPVVH